MAHHHEGESDGAVQANHCAPHEVLEHGVVFVLSHAVVTVQVDVLLSQAVCREEMMEHTHDGIGPLADIHCFIDQVIDLPGDGLTTHPKDAALSWGQKVDGARLERVGRVVYLLSYIEGVMDLHDLHVPRTRQQSRKWWWWYKLLADTVLRLQLLLQVSTGRSVQLPLTSRQ